MKAFPILVGALLTVISVGWFGFFAGINFPVELRPKLECSFSGSNILGRLWSPFTKKTLEFEDPKVPERRLPPGIVVSEADLHLRRLWGSPNQDGAAGKYLLAMAVGYTEKANVNAMIQKFSNNFDLVLYHYDGHTTEWDEFEWSKKATHVSAFKQTKWWFAKRFLHPSIVAPYEYIFIWDQDLGVDNFTAEEYIKIVRKHGLEISQPGLDTTRGEKTYEVNSRRTDGSEIHKVTIAGCTNLYQRPPCGAFVEVMAPVFSRDAWRCVWHMMQNDFVHMWGLDANFKRCVDKPLEQMGIVDAQWVVHNAVKSLKHQDSGEKLDIRDLVSKRQNVEKQIFNKRLQNADRELNSTKNHHQPC